MSHTGGLPRRDQYGMVIQLEANGLEARLWTISQTQRPGLAVSEVRQDSERYSCIVYSCGIGFIQLGPDGISLEGHLEFGEEGEGLLQFLPLGLLVTVPRCQRRPLPIAEP
jgi:hypothetical protein